MSSLRTARLLTSRLFTHSQCPHVLSRPYATKPNPKATAAKLNTVRRKAASRKTDNTLENDSLAARTPLKKPSSDGLGVPSASPSAQGPASAKGKNGGGVGDDGGVIADVAPAEAERKEARLREARQARVERTRVEEEKRRGEREYEEKKGGLKQTYIRLVIGLPIAGVLSWVLWNRLVNGKEQRKPEVEEQGAVVKGE